ncbi:MAG: FAD-dependent oxidoreductase [Betaproteobacteria bacterium]|nr:FAD-dependent oxidoreductase [Betaproteobacteria bacterium]
MANGATRSGSGGTDRPAATPTRYVVVGAGAAGVIAAETLRRADPAGDVVLVNGEGEQPYARMAIPYVLTGRIPTEGTHLRQAAGHYDGLGIRLVGSPAAALDTRVRSLRLQDGTALPFDRLLIATGSRPTKEAIPGIDLPGVHTCWTLADARAILATIRPGTRVVQMGAGFIGCIIMEGLVKRGAALTVLVRSGLMVSRMINPTAGDMIRRWCEAKGVRILPKTQTARIDAADGALAVTLTTGERLPADLYLSAVGVKPDIGWLTGSDVAIGNGVVVDEHLETSVPGIFAAGDVADAVDCVTGQRQVNAIQPNAVEQGRIAALNMAGTRASSRGSFAFNVLDTLGLVSSSFGAWHGVPGGDATEFVDAAHWRYVRLEFDGDRLVGANVVGFTDHLGALRGLIERRVRLGKWKARLVENPTQIMAAYLATVQAAA